MIQIGGLQRSTLIDYPGRVAATVFLTGCNFRCPFCYNPELVLPEKIEKQPKISERHFFDFLKKRKGLLEGVCLTGGEPTINKDLPEFIRKIKKLGFLVKLDTNGSNPEMLKKLIDEKLIDYVAMDVKVPQEKYKKIFGKRVKIEDVEESIKTLKEGKIGYEFRSTIIPGVHNKEDIIKMANWIRGAKAYYLQQFRREKTINPKFEKVKPYSREFLLEVKRVISPLFEICQLR